MSSFYLIKVPNKFNRSYENVIRATENNRLAQLRNLPNKFFDDYNFIRKDGVLNVGDSISSVREYNYCLVNNNGKYEYYFITNYHYVNDSVTAIELETDVFSTYFDKLVIEKSYIKRMHLPQEAEIPMIAEVGNLEYRVQTIISTGFMPTGNVLLCLSDGYSNIHGKPNTCKFYVYRDLVKLLEKLDVLTTKNKIDSIISLTYIPPHVPKKYADDGEGVFVADGGELTTDNTTVETMATYEKHTDSRNPYYKKLNMYPYTKFSLFQCGVKQSFPQHYFRDSISFQVQTNIAPSPTVIMTPLNYKGTTYNFENSFISCSYPQMPYSIDSFRLFMARSIPSVITATGLALTGLNPVSGMAIGNAVGNVISAINQPPIRQQTNSNVYYDINEFDIKIYREELNEESYRYFNHLFDRKGYAIEGITEVNLWDCEGYKYIEGELNINSTIPSMYYEIIKRAFSDGVTLWDDFTTKYRV